MNSGGCAAFRKEYSEGQCVRYIRVACTKHRDVVSLDARILSEEDRSCPCGFDLRRVFGIGKKSHVAGPGNVEPCGGAYLKRFVAAFDARAGRCGKFRKFHTLFP